MSEQITSKKQAFVERIPVLFMGPVAAMGVLGVGVRVDEVAGDMAPTALWNAVSGSQLWLKILVVVYLINFAVAWFGRHSLGWSVARLLTGGLFGYVCISKLVDLVGASWGFFGQVVGGGGSMTPLVVNGVRYALVAWSVGLLMMVVSVGMGFEEESA